MSGAAEISTLQSGPRRAHLQTMKPASSPLRNGSHMDFRPFCSAVVWFKGVVICEGPRRRLGPGPWAEAAPTPFKKKKIYISDH